MKIGTRIVAICAVALTVLGLGGCASFDRQWKTVESNTAGLNRRVTLYNDKGEVMREWEGVISLGDDDAQIMFDLDGKRYVIQGGIVVVEEV